MSVTLKRIILILFVLNIAFVCPIVAAITATRMLEESHIKEIQQYDDWKVHGLYRDKWNYCPNCGAKLDMEVTE